MKLARRTAFLLAAPVLLCSGCYSYIPAQLETVPVGENVRMTVTRQGRMELPETFDYDGPFITGTVVRRDADRLIINMPVAPRQEGFYVSQIGQEVGVRSGEIVQLEMRRLDRTKTGLFIAGTAAATALVVYGIIEASSRSQPGGPPVPDEFRIPLISIPVR